MKIYTAFVGILCICGIQAQGTYKAAVVEYGPSTTLQYQERLLKNVEEYTIRIEQAKEKQVNIIVFPEYGLTHTSLDVFENLRNYSVLLPDPKDAISPCIAKRQYAKVLENLSCAAETSGIYIVVNLIERVANGSDSFIYYNTNIVFDRNGGIIARYRKINLYQEPGLTPGNELVTFKTDFGATFGLFTCFDIVHKNPSRDILADNKVTDVIYPTAWLTEIPFVASLSVQAGYSKANNVNLLAAGYSEPSERMGGSGIYSANDSTTENYISEKKTTLLITKELKFPAQRNPDVCETDLSVGSPRGGIGGIIGGSSSEIYDFPTASENLQNYTFKALENKTNTYETVCSGSHCCNFNVTIAKWSSVAEDYVYKLAVFHGVRESDVGSLGIRVCALVACRTEDVTTCGQKSSSLPGKTTFDRIQISGTFTKHDSVFDQPSTLLRNMKPVANVAYCAEKVSDGKVKVTVTTRTPVDSVLTFGTLGRLYKFDNETPGEKNSAIGFNPSVLIMLLLSMIILRN